MLAPPPLNFYSSFSWDMLLSLGHCHHPSLLPPAEAIADVHTLVPCVLWTDLCWGQVVVSLFPHSRPPVRLSYNPGL